MLSVINNLDQTGDYKGVCLSLFNDWLTFHVSVREVRHYFIISNGS